MDVKILEKTNVHRDREGREDSLVLKVNQDFLEKTAKEERQAWVCKIVQEDVCCALLDCLDHKGLLVRKVHKDLLAVMVLPVEFLGQLDHQEIVDSKVHRELKERKELLEKTVVAVSRRTLDHPANQDVEDQLEKKEFAEKLAVMEIPESQADKVFLVVQEFLAKTELQEHLENQECQELMLATVAALHVLQKWFLI